MSYNWAMCGFRQFWSLNFSYHITHSYLVTSYLLVLRGRCKSPAITFSQFSSMCKDCSVSKNGNCVYISVLHSWYEKYSPPPIPGFFPLWLAVTFLVGNWSLCVILGHVYIMPHWQSVRIVLNFPIPCGCLCHHAMLLSPHFLQRPVCVPFCELSHHGCHCHLSVATASHLNQLGPRVKKLNSFAFSSHTELYRIMLLFSWAFYF